MGKSWIGSVDIGLLLASPSQHRAVLKFKWEHKESICHINDTAVNGGCHSVGLARFHLFKLIYGHHIKQKNL